MPLSPGRHRTLVVATLGTTQTLAWASTYYLPAVLADTIAADLNVSRDWFFGMFSASLLISAFLGPTVGRFIDRRGGRDILALSNVVFAAGLVVLALSHGPGGLAVAWTIIGVGMALGLYEPAFSTLAGLYGGGARSAITGITLIAGFASTVGWPMSTFLSQEIGWRGTCLAWAALHVLLGLPANRFLVPGAPPPTRMALQAVPAASEGVPRTLALLAVMFGASAFVAGAMAAHLPRLLLAAGVSPVAAVGAAALVGPAQVAARIVDFSLLRRLSPLVSARLAVALHPAGVALLAAFGAPAAVAFALLHGAGNGMVTIARGTLPLALFGATGYGLRTGLLAAPGRVTQAAAPLLFGMLLDGAGPTPALMLTAGLSILGLVALLALRSKHSQGDALGRPA
ncbi:MAG: transporter [Rhodospirillales bacterium]|nr:transporter [Rhodospirillales bacterium]